MMHEQIVLANRSHKRESVRVARVNLGVAEATAGFGFPAKNQLRSKPFRRQPTCIREADPYNYECNKFTKRYCKLRSSMVVAVDSRP